MTREQLLDRANRRARARYGSDPISTRMLADWVHEKIVTGPARVPHPGRRAARWEWSSCSYAQLLRVCRVRQRGVKSFDQLRIVLWLRSRDPLTETVRDSMLREYRWLHKRLFRPLRNDAGPMLKGDMGSHRRRPSLDRRRVDQRLGAFEALLPPKFKTMAYDAARFGAEFDTAPLIGLAYQFLGLPAGTAIEGEILDLRGAAQLAEDGDDSVLGSAEHSLATLGPEAFEEARQLFQLMRQALVMAPKLVETYAPALQEVAEVFGLVGRTLGAYPWNFCMCVLLLHGTRNAHRLREFNDAVEMAMTGLLRGEWSNAA